MQNLLWDVCPTRSNHHPGKLTICYGMPILIKHNEATEAGVTNGAEGTVIGWNSRPIGDGKETLETVFVKLKITATVIQVPGLPDNVVPVAAYTKSIAVRLGDDSSVLVSRTQVPVLLNFSMTDYGSQGRSRQFNPIDPTDCKNNQSLYTCLSRATSWKSTVLAAPIPPKLAQGKLSEQLRKEFQQLELLNVITKLRFEGRLPDTVKGETRTSLINAFQHWKGVDWCPPGVHPAIRWSKSDPIGFVQVQQSSPWAVIKPKPRANKDTASQITPKMTQYVVAKGSTKLLNLSDEPMSKRQPRGRSDVLPRPIGLLWDEETWSCAYDSILTILHFYYTTYHADWLANVSNLNDVLTHLSTTWAEHPDDPASARSVVQGIAHRRDEHEFPLDGHTGTSISALLELLLSVKQNYIVRIKSCIACGMKLHERSVPDLVLTIDSQSRSVPTGSAGIARQWLDHSVGTCTCGGATRSRITVAGDPPPLIAVGLLPTTKPTYTISMDFTVQRASYSLVGLIYHGAEHFTARLFDRRKNVWRYDGMADGGAVVHEGKTDTINDLRILNGREVCFALYTMQ